MVGALVAFPATAGVIDVTEHGAVPNSGENAIEAVYAALEAARHVEEPVLLFPPGRYDIVIPANHPHGRIAIFVNGFQNLTIAGPGAELFFEGLTAPFLFDDCSSLTVKDIAIDWDRPPFLQGEVIATAERSFDVRMDSGFPVEGGEPVQAYQDFDPETRLPVARGIDQYYAVLSTELVGDQVLRLHLKDWGQIPAVGSLAVLRTQVYAYNAFYFAGGADVVVDGVTVYTAPGMGFVGQGTHNVTLRNTAVRVREGCDRLMSTTADGSHFGGCTGTITIEDCLFERMGDDAGNFRSGLFLTIQEVEDEYTVTARHNLGMHFVPPVGHVMEFRSDETFLAYGERTLEGVEELPDNAVRLRFVERLPEEASPGHVTGDVTAVARVRVRNTTVRSNRARGFLIQTHDAIVEDCHFENITTAGVFVMAEIVHFFESTPARNVTIRNNVFDGCGFGAPSAKGIIMVFAYLADFRLPPEPGVIRDVTIENNTIRGGNSSGIFVAGGEGIVLRGNVITGVCVAPHRPDTAGAVYMRSSRNVLLENNTVRLEEQGPACDGALLLGPGNALDTFQGLGNTGFSLEAAATR